MARLCELARLIRSKNAGPFYQTIDIMFENPNYYEKVKDQKVITSELVEHLYNLQEGIAKVIYYDAAYSIKISFPQTIPAGSIGNRDMFGAQQHAPMLDIEVTI